MTKSDLIKDTTREEREEIIRGGLSIVALGNPPEEELIQMSQLYVDGILELDEIFMILDVRWKKRLEKYQSKNSDDK